MAKVTFKKYHNKFYYPISLIFMLPVIFYFGVQSYAAQINNTFIYNPIWSVIVSLISLILNIGFIVFLFQ